MAKQGNYAAMQKVTPYDDGVSRDIKYWNDDALRRRRQGLIEDQVRNTQQRQAKADKQAMYDKYIKPVNNYDTGSSSWNEANARLIQTAMSKYPELLAVLENPNSSPEEKIKAKLGFAKIEALPEKLKLISDSLTSEWSTYMTEKEKGGAWEMSAAEKAFQNGAKGVQFGLDDDFEPIIAFVDKEGKDGTPDGENDLLATKSYNEFLQYMPTFNYQKKHNPEALAKNLAESLGQADVTKEIGNYTTERVKAVRDEDLSIRTEKLLFGDNGVPTTVARDAVIRMGLDPNNPEQATPEVYEQIKNDFMSLTKTFLPEIRETKKDNSAENAAWSNSLKAQKQNQDQPSLSEVVEPSAETWGEENIKNAVSKNGGLSNVEIGAIKGEVNGEQTTLSDAVVKNYIFVKGGDMLLDVETVKTKSITETEFEKLELDYNTNPDKMTMADMNAYMIAKDQKPGSRRITKPGTKEKKVIKVPREDVADVARQAKITIQQLKDNVGYDENQETFDAEEFYKNYKSKNN